MQYLDNFYFYNHIFDVPDLIDKYKGQNIKAEPHSVVNHFGVIIHTKYFPLLLKGKEGTVEDAPIPANWHADMAEFGAALRAVDLAQNTFTMVELGCGWGCWMNITGRAAKKKGLKVNLIGIEGDEGHIAFAHESMETNGFSQNEYELYHGIAASEDGFALFPNQSVSGENWGLEPVFNIDENKKNELLNSGNYSLLKSYSLEEITRKYNRIDLLHVDIQGGEAELIPSVLNVLNEKVAYILIGTHARQIEGQMFDCLLKAGWKLEIERPALLGLNPAPYVGVDGVQGWRNMKLLPSSLDLVDSTGSIELLTKLNKVQIKESLQLKVKIKNASQTDWTSKSAHPVNISYQWSDENKKIVIPDGCRTPLKNNKLKAGMSIEQEVEVLAPLLPGKYHLHLTAVQEGISWFRAPKFQEIEVPITVVS